MKSLKLINILLALALVFALVGCEEDDDETVAGTNYVELGEIADTTGITKTGSVTYGDSGEEEYDWYVFTAAETAKYVFTFTSDSVTFSSGKAFDVYATFYNYTDDYTKFSHIVNLDENNYDLTDDLPVLETQSYVLLDDSQVPSEYGADPTITTSNATSTQLQAGTKYFLVITTINTTTENYSFTLRKSAGK